MFLPKSIQPVILILSPTSLTGLPQNGQISPSYIRPLNEPHSHVNLSAYVCSSSKVVPYKDDLGPYKLFLAASPDSILTDGGSDIMKPLPDIIEW